MLAILDYKAGNQTSVRRALDHLGIPCAVANILGNQLGTHLAIRIGTRMVRNFLYVTLCLLLASLIYRFFIA